MTLVKFQQFIVSRFTFREARNMNMISRDFLILAIVTLTGWNSPAWASDSADDKAKKAKPKFTIGKETTYVTEPVGKDGYVNYPTALNQRLAKGIKPENNAHVLIWKALGPRPEGGKRMPSEYFKWLGMDEPPEAGEYLIGIGAYAKNHLKLDEDARTAVITEHDRHTGRRPWTAKDYPHIAAWLKANEKPLLLAVEATKRPDFFNPLVAPPGGLIGALLPSVQKCREIATLLTARAMLHIGEGKLDEAWQTCLPATASAGSSRAVVQP
jgi:hypothetical protein